MTLKNSVRSSILIKMFAIGILAMLLLIPTGMIKNLINERSMRKNSAISEVNNKWGNKQVLAGPVLTIPYTVTDEIVTKGKDGETKTQEVVKTSYVSFLPEKLNFNGDVSTDLLKRGIYEITVYNSKLEVDGEFIFPDFSASNMPDENAVINWGEAHISFSLSDIKTLQEVSKFDWNGEQYDFKSGYKTQEIESMLGGQNLNFPELSIKERNTIYRPSLSGGSGLNVPVPVSADEKSKVYKFSFNIDVNGSDSIAFLPLGRETNVSLTSDWSSPSFNGSFLPDERNVSDAGFEAKWKVLELNRDYPQVWDGSLTQNIHNYSFGARMVVMVDEYQKNTRAVKYAIMFIALTFIVFFFVEALNRIQIHPIQYILVGLSLVLFFPLLISITEHLNFNIAYLISSVSTVLMITLYGKTIFKNMRLTLIQSGILTAIYIFIYTIIQLEDYALLFGSVGLFFVLAVIMYISRKIDWYSVGAKTIGDDK